MRKLWISFAAVTSLALAGCASADDGEPVADEETNASQEAITGACSWWTVGLPCDPDGAGPLLECQGVCSPTGTATATCTALSAAGVTGMNGATCGTNSSLGDAACANRCFNGACVNSPANKGAACRPTFQSNACDGVCDGAGACVPAAGGGCTFGRGPNTNCVFGTCQAADASKCVSANLPKALACSDSNACTSGDQCDGAGKCASGTPKSCNDNNVCTTDACNPNTGACISSFNTAACDDGDKCTTGDVCAQGSCTAGTGKLDCNDKNACTTDSCNSATGCVNTPKNCSDNDLCTTDGCNTTTGACTYAKVDCDDQDPCTTDGCGATTGCTHTPIPGCGTGGTGGATGGTGGATGGTGGATGGTGGATGGTGGATGGTGGATGGTAGATGGTAGAGGSAGSAGNAGSAGTAGSAGSAGSAGNAGSAGTGTGGSSTGGSTSSGGSGAVDAGADGGTKPPLKTEDDGGCGCRVPSQTPSAPGGAFLAALAALALGRRRRR